MLTTDEQDANPRAFATDTMRPMLVRLLLLMGIALAPLVAQSGLRYDQLSEFLRSSFESGFSDKEIAKFLKDQTLTFSLSDSLIEDFQGLGAGPRTLEALRVLQAASSSLPAPELTKTAMDGPPQPAPPSEEEQARIIAEARTSALDYTSRLPDFVCLQITRRFVDPSGLEMDWLKYDEVKTRVAYVEGKENYELVSVNNRTAEGRSMEDIGGASSTGEFGSILAALFAPRTNARFTWARHSLLRGHAVYVFHFRVPKARSQWTLSWEKTQRIISGYGGLVYIDKESERVLRIQMNAENIPPAFPITAAGTRLDYDYIDISGNPFLLPLKARVTMRSGRDITRNDVEFRLYRKFSAEATISFGEIDDLPPLPEEDDGPTP